MMFYNDMPLIIPLLATGYVLMIYLLLALAKYFKTSLNHQSSVNS